MILLVAVSVYARPPVKKVLPLSAVSHRSLQQLVRKDSGKVVLINVWASWCKPCLEELPALSKVKDQFSSKDFSLYLVSMDDREDTTHHVFPALKKAGIRFPTFIKDGESDEEFMNGMSPDWNGALPATFLFDRQGVLDTMLIGGRTYLEFMRRIGSLTKK